MQQQLGLVAVVVVALLCCGGMSFGLDLHDASTNKAREDSSKTKLNVLLIVSDDLRPEIGSFGGNAITPRMDE